MAHSSNHMGNVRAHSARLRRNIAGLRRIVRSCESSGSARICAPANLQSLHNDTWRALQTKWRICALIWRGCDACTRPCDALCRPAQTLGLSQESACQQNYSRSTTTHVALLKLNGRHARSSAKLRSMNRALRRVVRSCDGSRGLLLYRSSGILNAQQTSRTRLRASQFGLFSKV